MPRPFSFARRCSLTTRDHELFDLGQARRRRPRARARRPDRRAARAACRPCARRPRGRPLRRSRRGTSSSPPALWRSPPRWRSPTASWSATRSRPSSGSSRCRQAEHERVHAPVRPRQGDDRRLRGLCAPDRRRLQGRAGRCSRTCSTACSTSPRPTARCTRPSSPICKAVAAHLRLRGPRFRPDRGPPRAQRATTPI